MRCRAVSSPLAASRPIPEWRTRYLGPGWDLAKVRGTRFNTGDGIRMALDIGAAPRGNWSGCHAVGLGSQCARVRRSRGRRRLSEALLSVRHHGQRQRRALRRRGRGFPQLHLREVRRRDPCASPASSPGRSSTGRCAHLLRDEYRIRQVTKVTANTLEALVGKLDDVNRGQRAGDDPAVQRRGAHRHRRSTRTSRTAARTRGLPVPKSNWANPIDEPPFEAYAVSCGITFTFGGLRITTDAQVRRHRRRADSGPVCRRRAGRRPVLLQLSGRHRTDVGRGLRAHRRRQRRRAPRRLVTWQEQTFDVVVVGGGGSGLAAAIEARAAGREVVLLEKNDKLGGSTAWSIGSITSTGTPHQLRQRHRGPAAGSLRRHAAVRRRAREPRQRRAAPHPVR